MLADFACNNCYFRYFVAGSIVGEACLLSQNGIRTVCGIIEKLLPFLLKMCFAVTDALSGQIARNETGWLQGIARGDAAAERSLLLFFSQRIERIIRMKIGRNEQDIQDIKQEVFIAIIKSLRAGKFDASKGTLGAYIYSVTQFKIIDYLRAPKRTVPLEEDIDIPDTHNPHRDIIAEEGMARLRAQLEKLPLKYKEVLYKRYFQDLSISEISEAINLPARRVSERINYAKKLLRNVCTM